MKVYFAGSIRGGEPDREWFQQLIGYIKQYGQVMTEHSFDFSYEDEITKDDVWIYNTDMGWLRSEKPTADAVSAAHRWEGLSTRRSSEATESTAKVNPRTWDHTPQ